MRGRAPTPRRRRQTCATLSGPAAGRAETVVGDLVGGERLDRLGDLLALTEQNVCLKRLAMFFSGR